jgi:hypothetical protein
VNKLTLSFLFCTTSKGKKWHDDAAKKNGKAAVTQKYKQCIQDTGSRTQAELQHTKIKIRISLAVVSLYNDFRRAA